MNTETQPIQNSINHQLTPLKDTSHKSGPRQFISSNQFEPRDSLLKKIVQPAQFAQIHPVDCYFCGGASCSKERAINNKFENAIKGLHSNWITENILAMQRPSTQLIQEYQLIQQFKQNNIGAIINLQEQGEHGKCGPGLIPKTGFTYDPETFSNEKISCFNFGWEDMTVDINFQHLIKICSAFDMMFKEGKKVSVHCHAGTGRTGVGICAWLIFHDHLSAEQAIKLFQSRRANSLSKSIQHTFLKEFEQYLINSRKLFDYPILSNNQTIDQIVIQQNKLVVGKLKSYTKKLPIPIYIILDKYVQLINGNLIRPQIIIDSFINLKSNYFQFPYDQNQLNILKDQFNQHIFNIGHIQDERILSQLLLQYLEQLPNSVINDKFIFKLSNLTYKDKNDDPNDIINQQLNDVEQKILQSLIKFMIFLKQNDQTIQLKSLIVRFSIALVKQRNTLDNYFYADSLILCDQINLPSIQQLYKFINYWIEYDLLKPIKTNSSIF